MEEFKKFILDYIDNTLEKTHGVALSLIVESERLKDLGLYDTDTEKDFERVKNRTMGVYEFCQDLEKKIKKYGKEE